ncbi:hypothetical protein BKA82DRAFT_29449 [Pisolithus tinctorius]|uniref:Uncharacterized protein n=1 Tax=Pisolithus tinctorius Marx 270 TaxID=870435 RepID=A0A0C3JST2_PISTI|nr:hypothetical protein BKA82DRAFT_29449 [Pisolithus tinctorius]KIO00532.1 hypothetical protein M404DRAFT_29449 [Pisolithus tinctorius Marx 270]
MYTHFTTHALVCLLKAPTDPPSPDRPFKIDIMNDVWSDMSFGAVKMAEILVAATADTLIFCVLCLPLEILAPAANLS